MCNVKFCFEIWRADDRQYTMARLSPWSLGGPSSMPNQYNRLRVPFPFFFTSLSLPPFYFFSILIPNRPFLVSPHFTCRVAVTIYISVYLIALNMTSIFWVRIHNYFIIFYVILTDRVVQWVTWCSRYMGTQVWKIWAVWKDNTYSWLGVCIGCYEPIYYCRWVCWQLCTIISVMITITWTPIWAF